VHAFAIQANGALSSVDTDAATAGNQASIAADDGTNAFVLDPAGRFAYAANFLAFNGNDFVGTVSVYTVNATTGALTSVGAVDAAFRPRSVTVDPSGKFAYVANYSTVSAYSINATTGALTALAGSPFTAGTNPGSVTVDPSGKFLYVTNIGSSDTTVFTLDAVTGVPGAARTIAGRNGNQEMAMTRGTAAVTYTPKFAYVANQFSNNVSTYTINATTGALTSIDAGVAAGTQPNSVTVDPSGKFAYVANSGSDNVSAYTINATTGALTSVGAAVAAGSAPASVTVDPSGKFAYVANYVSNNVSAYTIDATTGVLSGGAVVAAGFNPFSVTVDPSSKFAYVANRGGNNVSAYTINASTGALVAVVGSPFATGVGTLPFSVTVDPTGKFAYVALMV
jgi:YVTN family beta-propeller protein